MIFESFYEVRAPSLNEAQLLVEGVIGLRMEERESSFIGDYCLLRMAAEAKLTLYENIDPIDGEIVHSRFPDARFILRVDEVGGQSDDLKIRLVSPSIRVLGYRSA